MLIITIASDSSNFSQIIKMKNDHTELSCWIALTQSLKVSPSQFSKILHKFDGISSLFASNVQELELLGCPSGVLQAVKNPNWKQVDLALRWAEKIDHFILTWDDPLYPHLLKQTSNSPPVLYGLGTPQCLNNPQIAMVGSRSPTPEGLQMAENFASQLTQHLFTITSGLAYGIDQASHKGAVNAGGPTIAVIGSGLCHIYPPRQEKLIEKIIQTGGAIISEFPLSEKPQAYYFPQRNRIISGLSLGVLVVEAALKSGSLITAKLATEQGREVFAIPGSIYNSKVKGCHALIRQGAKLIEGIECILEELPPTLGALKEAIFDQKPSAVIKTLDQEGEMLIECMGCEVASTDSLIVHSGLTPERVISKLLVLELQGEVIAVPGGYMRVKRF